MQKNTCEPQWQVVCSADSVLPFIGVRALLNGKQVAIFRVGESLYAIDAVDPFSKAAVLSRGLVGDLQNQLVVASPVFKQHFNLDTGVCLEYPTVAVATYGIRERLGNIEIDCSSAQQLEHDEFAAAANG